MKYDVIIIGSGPTALWTAFNLQKENLSIAILEKNTFSSGGLVNDCKLNLNPEICMDIDELKITIKEAEKYIREIDNKFLEHGADKTLYGTNEEEIKKWQIRAERCGAKLISSKQRHIGTDMSIKLIQSFKKELEKNKVKFFLNTEVKEIEKNKEFKLKTNKGDFYSKYLVVAPGRSGAYWLRNQAKKQRIDYKWGPIDVGVRIELPSEIYDPITDIVYDPKFIFLTKHHRDKVRTFCTNKHGKVRLEPKNGDFILVNGDALKNHKTMNTNFAILNTINLTEPYADTTEYGRDIAKEVNRLGGGKPIVQRMGDFLDGRRSKLKTFFSKEKNYHLVKPTIDIKKQVVPGDISMAYPGRIVNNLYDSLVILDKIVPGVLHSSNLIYAPEIKFYDTKYITDKYLETNLDNLFVGGDGAGKSRGITGAALNGILIAKGIKNKL